MPKCNPDDLAERSAVLEYEAGLARGEAERQAAQDCKCRSFTEAKSKLNAERIKQNREWKETTE